MVVKQLLLTLIFSVSAFAVEAKIDGPDESLAGDLVVLNSVNTVADKKQWIIPTALENRYIQTEHQIAFAVRDAGEYRFGLVAVEADEVDGISIDIARHTVTISGGICDPIPPTDPIDPTDPPPVDQPPASELRVISRDAAAKLNDKPTATLLAQVLSSISANPIDIMAAETRSAVEAVLLARTGVSRDADWLGVWRRPVNDSIKSTTPAGRLAELQAIAAGLRDSLGQIVPVPDPLPNQPITDQVTVIMYSRPDCSYCNQWKANVMPTIKTWNNWVIDERAGSGDVPEFHIITPDGKITKLIGYRGLETFEQFK